MRCPGASVLCLLPPLVALLITTHTLCHSQWPKPPRFVHATAPARQRLKCHRPRAIRPLGRYGGARAIGDSPSDVGACHRVVRRHTCCSPVTRRSMRATQAREPRREWALAGQPLRRIESEPRGPSQLRGVRGVSTHRTAPITNRHDSSWFENFRSHFALFWSFWLAISEPGWTSENKIPLGIRLISTRPS